MSNFKTHGQLDESDVTDIVIDDIIQLLENSRDPIEQDIDDIISAGDYDNRDADDFFQTAIDILAYAIIQGDEDGIDVMGNDRSYEKVLRQAMGFAVAVFATTDREISDRLSDRDYNEFSKLADTHVDILGYLKEEVGGSRGRSRGRDTRRSSGRRDEPRGRDRHAGPARRSSSTRRSSVASSYGRNKPRNDERRSGRGGASGRGIKGVASNYRRPQNTGRRNHGDVEDVSQPANLPDSICTNQPKLVLVEKSIIKPSNIDSWVIDPTKHGVYHAANDDNTGVIETVISYDEDGMEDYEQHEIVRSPISTNKNNGVVIPQVDFRTLPEMSTPEQVSAAVEAKYILGEPLNIVATRWDVDQAMLGGELHSDLPYTIAKANQYRMLTIPKGLEDVFEGAERFTTFESWHNLMSIIQDKMEEMSPGDKHVAGNLLSQLEEDLRLLFNNLLAIVIPEPAGLNSFIKYFYDAMVYLKAPERTDEYEEWRTVEKEYLRHNYSLLTDDVTKGLIERKVLSPAQDERVTRKWIHTNLMIVKSIGELMGGSLMLSNANAISQVEFKYTPDFYSVCERLLENRNNNLKMSTIVMVDSTNTQVMLLSGNRRGGTIKLRKL